MLQTTIHALLTGSLVPSGDEFIYIVRSGEDVMYVGKTRDPNRRMEQHFTSTFLTFTMEDKRDVLRWTVELREVKECQEYIPPNYAYFDLDAAEVCTIQALNPVLNATYNFHASPMPERYKPLFEIEPGLTDNLY